VPHFIFIAAGEHGDVLRSEMQVARKAAPGRHVADEEDAVRDGIVGQNGHSRTAGEPPAPAERRPPQDLGRQLRKRRGRQGEAGQGRRLDTRSLRTAAGLLLADPLAQALPERGGQWRRRQTPEQVAA